MQFDLVSATDLAVHAVFDPAAMLHLINDATVDPTDEHQLDKDIERGNVVLYSNASDGGVRFRVYVDDEPDADLSAHSAHGARDLLLRVPSGTLFACGYKYLLRPDREPIEAGDFAEATHALGEGKPIPAWNYRVDAFEIRRPTRELDRLDHIVGAAYGSGCWATSTAVVLLTGALAFALADALGDREHVLHYWAICAIAFGLLGVVAELLMSKRPSVVQHKRELQQSRERFPFDVALVLKRLPVDVDLSALRGGRFGRGCCGAGAALHG